MRRTTVVMAAVLNGARSLAPPPKITLDAAMACAAPLPAGAPRLVMGSKSASRRALLEAMGCEGFDTRVADIDEFAIGDRRGDPAALVTAVAAAKCDALLERHFAAETDDDVVLVTGDQVVTFDGKIREKPRDLAEAKAFAQSYSGAACGTVGCVITHDVARNERRVAVHEATVNFSEFPDGLVDAILAADGEIVLACAGGLMVEHPLLQPHVARVDGGVDSLMGLSTPVLARQLEDVVAARAAAAEAHPLVYPDLGPVLGRPSISRGRWAVIGDVTNERKVAHTIFERIALEAADAEPVSPYAEGVASSVTDLPGPVDVANVVVSPKIGAAEIAALAARGVRYAFLQPGADAANVILAARKHGVVVQRGCVLVNAWPPKDK